MRGYKMFACQSCSFEFVSPLPTKEEIEVFYNKTRVVTDLKQIIKQHIEDFDKGEPAPKIDWFKKVIGSAKKYTQKQKLNILEIGSGYGYFIHYAGGMGHGAVGTEVTAEYAEAGNNAVNGNIFYVPDGNYDKVVNNQWADLVYLEHVFEHVLEPGRIIEQVKNKISVNGVLYVSVPNSKSFMAKLMGGKWPWACPPDHLYFYNTKCLSAFLEKNGFEVLESFTGDYYFRSIYQMYSFTPYINIIRKKLKLKQKAHSYKYPGISDIFNLMPYWILWPFLKIMGPGTGNELTVIARLKPKS
ncbi:MAG TPA: class I SAM-dependent methyltransferase [Bacteroidia bacterium]|jgi:predicted SAM-dependent methyltransferase|nr:class I SAM-dependent methyltransferase [Bacteroidia bacterium]